MHRFSEILASIKFECKLRLQLEIADIVTAVNERNGQRPSSRLLSRRSFVRVSCEKLLSPSFVDITFNDAVMSPTIFHTIHYLCAIKPLNATESKAVVMKILYLHNHR